MSMNNESKIALEINNKKPSMLYDEVDLISTNRRINKTTDNSGILVVNQNDNLPKRLDNSTVDYTNLVYGISIDIHNPRKMGLVYAFFYINNFPLFIIGPDCK